MQALLYNIDMRNARENLKNNPKQIRSKSAVKLSLPSFSNFRLSAALTDYSNLNGNMIR